MALKDVFLFFRPFGPTKGIDFKGLGLEIGNDFVLSRFSTGLA